ncbi:5-formyltetrahydrofolate cyclo-ligase [Mycolicibacterium pyrenivorans]|uniref:5-formyltetrahydrofolate cyclo-ligase n=1 Tax=Mycolicibacterium pyrenivorans TaxID=187102 RepID=UPI0021F32DBA|nr:5-formyltetrahydrofolate cyclo-ligase [Mycolicibacterium pyrenivorans]MCV7150077.1 5-formyltetrahydrofolate cyclo-ligase [Mycolicibacterium pyrenivorans]
MHSTKAQLRAAILAARRSVAPQTRATEAAALAGRLSAFIDPGQTVCAYVPVGSEPGSLDLLDATVRRGVEVLLPVARHSQDGTALPLQWGRYRPGKLVGAPFGLREPPQPWASAEAIAEAAVVLVPALAVDRQGTRLGRGAGFYDRTLPMADAGALLVAMVRDDELLEHLPSEPHDVPMTHALTPREGLVVLARRGESTGPPGGSST